MANTLIQIKRSTSTSTPAALSIGELAYSYQSNTLFIGNTTGDGVIAIGGAATADIANSYATAVGIAGNTYANGVGTAGNTYASSVGTAANLYADGVGTSANAYADTVGSAANNFAGTMANSANAYTSATYLPLTGGTLSGDLVVSANLTVTGTTTFVNTQSLLVSDNIFVLNADLPIDTAPSQDAGMEVNRGSSANVFIIWDEDTDKWQFTNDGSTYVNLVGNTELQSVATSANAYAASVGTSANVYADGVGTSANVYAASVGTSANVYAASVGVAANLYSDGVGTSANVYAASVGTSANVYADAVGTAANTNAANGSYISSGIVKVPYGGTGVTSFTTNGIVYGNNTGDLKVTAAGTEGQVLQASATGVPQFGMLDGGSF